MLHVRNIYLHSPLNVAMFDLCRKKIPTWSIWGYIIRWISMGSNPYQNSLKPTAEAPENGWLEYDRFLLRCPMFRCELSGFWSKSMWMVDYYGKLCGKCIYQSHGSYGLMNESSINHVKSKACLVALVSRLSIFLQGHFTIASVNCWFGARCFGILKGASK